ncbi:hypothetical protein MCOR27_007870 [Pyricularia oryzae]|uniref:Major facilitator superfamily (MFS) profile domain-containing protein n=1 Tax=Pyricularia grisea TaxID=148305 RepID=A0ABQ8NQA1_PYRGI|nr:hypothetical protein MCOR01_011474 [Pyricularia oryzae]KAI6300477.1 hypothetical protein MCOR33_003882 [Pyricularia grisea]KAI6273398.1 hypothetical protein MCOR27_007870 [Pyricularia oryzae]KAI6278370.1 hypothetical protein MCOR26_004646 [Pyricularia oryzae]KAI6305112.1 hypothetical protein MCOR29_010634 [Pyricularia oryzae]
MSSTTTTTTTTTTSIRLEPLSIPTTNISSNTARQRGSAHPGTASAPLDPILEASRQADSQVPEGGYGWVVAGCCFVLSFWIVGITYSWGVMQAVLTERGLASPSTLSFAGSLAPSLISAMAVINAQVFRKIGARWMAASGIGLLGVGMILAGFAIDSVPGLFMTNGVIVGLGMGMCFSTSATMPAQYFSRRRGLANGIVFSGGGFGGAALSVVSDKLIQRLGPAWTYRTIGLCILATGLPAAFLIRERAEAKTARKTGLGNSSSSSARGMVEWALFKDPAFVFLFAASAIGTFPLLVPPFFIPLYAQRGLGLASATGAGLLAGFNLTSAVGRIASGILCDKLGAVNTLFSSFVIGAISMLVLWPASTSLAPLAVFVVVNGVANGAFFSTMPTVAGNVFGSARVGVAMGMLVTGWGGGYLMGAPIAGHLLDAYGGSENGLQAYRPAMFYAGSLTLASGTFTALMRYRLTKAWLAKI